MIFKNGFIKRTAVLLVAALLTVSMCCYAADTKTATDNTQSTKTATDNTQSTKTATDNTQSPKAATDNTQSPKAATDNTQSTGEASDNTQNVKDAEGDSGLLQKVEDAVNGIDIKSIDDKLQIEGIDSSDELAVSKEIIYIAVIAGILLIALCVILIVVAAGHSSRIKQLEKDKLMLEEEEDKRHIREEQLARRLMENQKRAHDEKWLRQRALIEDNKKKAALQQAILEEKRLNASRKDFVEVLKKINHKKRLEALCKEQEMLLAEQPWLRADRN